MKNKRGLSQVVTTVILILLIIMAIAGIWIVVDRVILQGTSRINLEQFTIDLKIVSAKINYSSEIAEIRVRRNQGEGNLTAIKFIVEDQRTSEVFEERFTRFEELAEKTFTLDLLISGSDLIIYEIDKISIAPVYVGGSSSLESLGSITDSISGIKKLNITGVEDIEENNESGGECTENIDCGEDFFIEGTRICNELNDGVLQYKKVFTCIIGFCYDENVLITLEFCPTGYFCFDGNCIEEEISCTNETVETDCGIDNWVGSPECQTNPEAIIQNFRTYACNDESCESTTNILVKEECVGEEICYEGECFEALECVNNADCMAGYICEEGECVLEEPLNIGVIRSAWPFGIGEYFDSFNLPLEGTDITMGQQIIFPNSAQTGCLQIKEFFPAPFDGGISYIRLNEPSTNISDNDNYEIWETDYICSTL